MKRDNKFPAICKFAGFPLKNNSLLLGYFTTIKKLQTVIYVYTKMSQEDKH